MALAIITGGSVGLGYQSAIALASAGFDVVLTSRDWARGEAARVAIGSMFPDRRISQLRLDLSEPESIEEFCNRFRALNTSWDVLVNNAGAKVLRDYQESGFGCEYHFGVNAVGHFALTADLFPYRSPTSKVVTVSSIVAGFAPRELGPCGSATKYQPGASYAASKLSDLLFALELDRRYGSKGFQSVAAHPGFARAEPYGSAATNLAERLFAQSAQKGALPIVAAAKGSMDGSYLAPSYLQLWGEPKAIKFPSNVSLENQKLNWKILSDISRREL